MLYQTIQFATAGQSVIVNAAGQALWYESSSMAVDSRIKVTPDSGDTVFLRPGQSVRFEDPSTTWTLTPLNGAATGNANILIGSGEFTDNNTTIGAIAGSVAISNLPALQTVKDVGSYTGTYSGSGTAANGAVVTVISPAANINGAIVEAAGLTADAGGDFYLLAKVSAPIGVNDGARLLWSGRPSAGSVVTQLARRMQLPPGMGLYLWPLGTPGNQCSVQYTLL